MIVEKILSVEDGFNVRLLISKLIRNLLRKSQKFLQDNSRDNNGNRKD
jgi:hypothetical protein